MQRWKYYYIHLPTKKWGTRFTDPLEVYDERSFLRALNKWNRVGKQDWKYWTDNLNPVEENKHMDPRLG